MKLLGVERWVSGAGEADRILIIAVAGLVVAVEEYLGLVDSAVKQTVYASAGVVILTELVDKVLLVDVVQIKIAARGSVGYII